MNKLKIDSRDLKSAPLELRRNGVVPGAIYGATIKSTAIKATSRELQKASKRAGEIYQVVSKEGPVLVKFGEVQQDPVTREILHFSLVEMQEGVESEVEIPLTLQGTPVGVKKGGVLVVLKDEILVNGKPRAMPKHIVGNISSLDIGDKLTIDDLKIPKKVDALEDDLEVVAICSAPTKEEPVMMDEQIIEKQLDKRKDSLKVLSTQIA